MADDDSIDFLISRTLPRPLQDLIEPMRFRAPYDDTLDAHTTTWVRQVGDKRAGYALYQLIQILACPPEIVCGFDVGKHFEESYGFISFFGRWQMVLCRALGMPVLPVPSKAEWYSHWESYHKRVASVGRFWSEGV